MHLSFFAVFIVLIGIFFTKKNVKDESPKMGVLMLVDQGIQILAPRDVIQAYSHEKDPALQEEMLQNMISDPENTVSNIPADENIGEEFSEEDVTTVEGIQVECVSFLCMLC